VEKKRKAKRGRHSITKKARSDASSEKFKKKDEVFKDLKHPR
jgi:hypothetical protein